MNIKVDAHKIEITKVPINEKEIDISICEFEFADEITSDYVKEAYFTLGDETYKQIIVDNKCSIPSEVLIKKGTVELGVVAYLVENEEEIKRYNPSPAYFDTWVGSLKDDAENSQPITPSEMEQFEQALQEGLAEVDGKLDDMDEALTEVDNLDVDASKVDTTTTITITKKDGTTKQVQVLDGRDGQDGAKGDPFTYEDFTPEQLEALTGPQGPAGQDGRDGYIQYTAGENILINNNVISAEVPDIDLDDYYTKTEVNDLIASAITDALGGNY